MSYYDSPEFLAVEAAATRARLHAAYPDATNFELEEALLKLLVFDHPRNADEVVRAVGGVIMAERERKEGGNV